MAQLKISRQVARDFANCTAGPCDDILARFQGDLNGVIAVAENRHTGEETRWSSIHELVLNTADGKLWRRLYERGLTEDQDIGPFEDEGSEVSFDEVTRKVVESYEYERV